MSYKPTEWKSGDVVTSAKLNKMENGITTANNKIFIISHKANIMPLTLNKTWQEIFNAMENGPVFFIAGDEEEKFCGFVSSCYIDRGDYYVDISAGSYYIANSENEYPVIGDIR